MDKVNIYGDSLLRGTVIDEAGRYHAVAAPLLEELGTEYGLCFANRARFGITAPRGGEILQKDIAQGLDCRYALVEFGGNDCSFAWDEVAQNPTASHQPFTSPEAFEETLYTMVQALQGAGVVPVMMSLPPLDAERHLHFVGKTQAARKNILQWLGDAQMIYRFHELYARTVERVARKTGSILVDVRARFLQRHNLGELIGRDGVHLSEKGYREVADAFADFLRSQAATGMKSIQYA